MTTRLSMFNSPFLLGFDQLERRLDRIARSSDDGYPPYNIEQIGERLLRITLAVAGFAESDLEITLEDRQLTIRGKQADEASAANGETERVLLHRGIASRQFKRSFMLAEGIEVDRAWLDKGLLHIDLARPQPGRAIQTIAIQGEEKSKDESAAARGGEAVAVADDAVTDGDATAALEDAAATRHPESRAAQTTDKGSMR